MARPSGQFDAQAERCYSEIRKLAQLGFCFATSGYLAKRLGVVPRQVDRYIAELKKKNRIEVITGKPLRDAGSGRFYRKRFIRTTEKVTPLQNAQRPASRKVTLPPVITTDAPETTYADEAILALLEENRQKDNEVAEMLAAFGVISAPEYEADFRELQQELAASGITLE